jgi:hypothetical protein
MTYGYFDYSAAPEIFLGRTGSGPLQMAWDTNVLVDYLQYGLAMWETETPPIEDTNYLKEVEAIGFIIDPIYFFWDIRIHLFDEILDDAKGKLSIERKNSREQALYEFAHALLHAEWEDEPEDDDTDNRTDASCISVLPIEGQVLPFGDSQQGTTGATHDPGFDAFAIALPNGHDRILVSKAVERGMHVFITRDRGILRSSESAKKFGLLIASPVQFRSLFNSAGIPIVQFPTPDLSRMSHIISALENVGEEA